MKSPKKNVASASSSTPIRKVIDPYAETDVSYQVIATDPCNPRIYEVPKGTAGAYPTLADAKDAAREILQTAIATAKNSLTELRQLGIDKIDYLAL